MGSGYDDWIYWHFFTITFDYNSSHTELLLNDVRLTNLYEETRLNLFNFLSVMLRPMVSRPVCLGIKHPSGAYDQILLRQTVAGLLMWGTFSDERTALSFKIVSWPSPASL
jgi:hypothetical protein